MFNLGGVISIASAGAAGSSFETLGTSFSSKTCAANYSAGALLPAGRGDPTWLDNPVISQMLGPEIWHTLGTTLGATLLTIIIATPLGLALVAWNRGGLAPHLWLYRILSFIVNVGRSMPFIILIISLVGFTRLIAGTALGWKAAIVPLVVGAVPFFARLVEGAILALDQGKIEAAQMMGASRRQIMIGVQLREALPALIQSATVLCITMLGFSAISGTVGGEGLGMLIYNYGYSQFMNDVSVAVVLVIIVIVQIIQIGGDMLSRLVDHR